MSASEAVRLYDAPDLVERRTVTGWVDRNGRFWGDDEHMARACSATHRRCRGCADAVPINSLVCRTCYEREQIARYEAMPRREWDGSGMIYSEANEQYYSSLAEADDDLAEGQTLASMRLVICDPQYLRAVDTDYWEDAYPDGCGSEMLPDAVSDALAALNEAIKGAGPISWAPGKFALLMSPVPVEENLARG